MSEPATRSISYTFSDFNRLFNDALVTYAIETGKDLLTHPLASNIHSCDSPDAILAVLRHAAALDESRHDNFKLAKWLQLIVHGLYAPTDSAVGVGSHTGPSPSRTILSALGVLLYTAKSERESHDILLDIFDSMAGFIARLRIYSEIPPIPAVTAIIIKMTVEILSALALATKQVQHAPFNASARGRKEITEVDARYNENQTVLHIASQHGDLEVMHWLFEHGADADAKNENQETPLFLASRNGNLEATTLLLRHGAKVDHRDWQERTPLHGASENGHEKVSKVLLDHGASVNAEGVYKWTPLHLASRAGNGNIVRLLLHNGANVDARNDLGWTPLHMASQVGNLGVVKLLLTLPNPAAVNAQKADGETALHLAAYYGHLEVARTLLDKGAGLDIRNKAGKEPLDLARLRGHQKVEELLKTWKSGGN